MDKKNINIAIVGLGFGAEFIPIYQRYKGVTLAAICQRNQTKLDEIVFFEWLVIKRISFGTDTFFYQQRRVTEEIGIKRTRLETLRKLFINLGLVVEYGNVFNTATYTVSLVFIANFIKYGVKKEFQETRSLNIDKLHFNTKKPLSIKDRKKIKNLFFLFASFLFTYARTSMFHHN